MRLIVINLISTLCVSTVLAGNPVIPGIGMSDPHVRVFNDTVYLFTGHDSHPNDRTWVMKDWQVYSSTNLVHWNHETTISPGNNYMGVNTTDCWAGDAAERDGNYYFYFSDQKRSIGVMKAAAPGGSYMDVLGKPLVAPMHDPTLFVDDDMNATPYLVYGDKAGGGYRIARISNTMISLDETPKQIEIDGKSWETAPKWMDKNYLFKHNGTYYLSWGRDYATSKNVYGPYTCAGALGEGHHLSELAHGSFFWYNGQFYHIWTYYIRPGYKYRECIITYCHFNDDGRVVTDTKFLDAHFETGVGNYEASWPIIEAEWYFGKSETIKKTDSGDGGFELSNIENGSWIRFDNMNFGTGVRSMNSKLTNISGKGFIELRLDSVSGPGLGRVEINRTLVTDNYTTLTCKLRNVSGRRDLFLVFIGEDNFRCSLDNFTFEK